MSFIIVEENFSGKFTKCIDDWKANYVHNQPNQKGFIVGELVSGHTLCIIRSIDRHNGLFAAVAAFIVAWFTFSLRESTNRLWEAGERQRESSERIASRQRESSERIGEAQVRAYVNIKAASLEFIVFGTIVPVVKIVASNSGQSPARNFVWNITLQYVGGAENRSRPLVENWIDRTGMDIPATSDAPPEAAIISEMSVVEHIEKTVPGLVRTIARVKIEFRYTDVFEKVWFGEQFYAGIMAARMVTPEDEKRGLTRWSASISPMARPSDWDNI